MFQSDGLHYHRSPMKFYHLVTHQVCVSTLHVCTVMKLDSEAFLRVYLYC